MLSLDDLLKFAKTEKIPLEKRRGIVREYMQTLILFYLQRTKYAPKLIFTGGTALRFFYDLQRFSEDLDFNYQGNLKKEDLINLMKYLQLEMSKENIDIEFSVRKSQETYFHWKIYIQFTNVLQFYKCSGRKTDTLYPTEKLSIQLDFQNLGQKKYPIKKQIISRFGKRFLFNTTPLEMFLAEKSNAILFRKIPRGRDFFDLMSLLLLNTEINIKYLKMREIKVKDKREYIKKIKNKIKKLNFTKLTAQLEPFLFNKEDVEIMKNFKDYIDDLVKKNK